MTNAPPIWMISNAASGSHKQDAVDAVLARFAASGRPVDRHFHLGEDELPRADEANAAGVGLVVLHGGDGTVTSTTDRLDGWDGEILVLPGGTMNLLAKALHGDMPADEIVAKVVAGEASPVRVPVIHGEGYCALAGVIAGPTSAWGDVREHVRNLDVRAIAASVSDALDKTLGDNDIRMEGHEEGYQAFYLQPGKHGISIKGVLARNAGELLGHGWAWLSGDFREGPSETLGVRHDITLHGREAVGLLVDGERAKAGATLHFRQGESAHRYLSVRGDIVWTT